eukprot:1641354-Prymnesium_polylepis.1
MDPVTAFTQLTVEGSSPPTAQWSSTTARRLCLRTIESRMRCGLAATNLTSRSKAGPWRAHNDYSGGGRAPHTSFAPDFSEEHVRT